jgi:hypothetical protein
MAAALSLPLGCATAAGTGTTAPAIAVADAPTSMTAARRPDAVPLEESAALPVPGARAEARGVVALVEPPTEREVVDLLRDFFDAWRSESIDGLAALLTTDAGPLDARARGRAALVDGWRARLRSHPYGRLEGTEILRTNRIERWTDGELGTSGAPARPPDMQPGELVFGDVVEMLLRPEDGKLRIAAYGESDTERAP